MPALAPSPAIDALSPLPRTDNVEKILDVAVSHAKLGEPIALVTLVGVSGRSARNLGAQMVVLGDGRHCGYVAGGCIEAAVAAEAQHAIATGHDRMLKLGEGSAFFDIVLPCGGSLDLAIQIIHDTKPLIAVQSAMAAREAAALVLDLGTHTVTARQGKAVTGWDGDKFIRAYQARTRLIVYGRGIETEALIRLASASGLDVVCVTPDPVTADIAMAHECSVQEIVGPDRVSTAEIDAHCAVALMFHDLDWDVEILSRIIATDAFYIGALGSHTTHEKRCAALVAEGLSSTDIARIKGPIGAFGPARDAATLATSILADVMGARAATS